MYQDSGRDSDNGLHIIVLSTNTANRVAKYVFDTYTPTMEHSLIQFLESLSPGRLVIFTVKDDASSHLQSDLRSKISKMFGSKQVGAVGFRSMWAMAATTGDGEQNPPLLLGESISLSPDKKDWAERVALEVDFEFSNSENTIWCPNWGEENGDDRFVTKRRKFCQSYGGYSHLCNCDRPDPVRFAPEDFNDNQITKDQVVIMACNRPHSLYKVLRSVLTAFGCNRENVWVMISGYDYDKEMIAMAELFGVHSKVFSPKGVGKNRITQHYGLVLKDVFDTDREESVENVIILEDDLMVSPDFFSYFSQTKYLMEEDPSIWCISAWNDHGFGHTSSDPSLVYRVQGMPGLGWMLSKRLFKCKF